MYGIAKAGEQLLNKIAVHQERNAKAIENFWAHVNVDVEAIIKHIPIDTIDKMQHCLSNGIDFALKNEEGGYVYFINPDIMLTWHPTDQSARSVTKINASSKAFMNNLKLVILGHRIFVSAKTLKFNKVYLQITNSL